MTDQLSTRTRWLALVILCVGDLMIVVDTTVVNVALPSIRSDLGFSQTSLAWVVNAYMITFGGFLAAVPRGLRGASDLLSAIARPRAGPRPL